MAKKERTKLHADRESKTDFLLAEKIMDLLREGKTEVLVFGLPAERRLSVHECITQVSRASGESFRTTSDENDGSFSVEWYD